MTVTLHLKPEVEASLSEQARPSGMALEEFVLTLIEEAASSAHQSEPSGHHQARVEAVRKMLEFGEKHRLSLGEPVTRSLLHEGHRF